MLDNYTPRAVTDPKCFLNGRKPEPDETICPVTMEVALIHPNAPFLSIDDLTMDDLSYFSQESLDNGTLKQFIQNVTSFTLSYNVRVDYTAYQDFEASCFDWNIKQIYDYTDRNLIKMTLNTQQMNCGNFNAFSAKPMFGVNIVAVLLLAFASLILTLNYFFSIAKMYKNIREKYVENENRLKAKANLSYRKIMTKNQKFITKTQETFKRYDVYRELSQDQAASMA